MAMRSRLASSKILWVWAVVLITSLGVEANPLKEPKRTVNGYAIDLTPLFRWWAKHQGERPLKAWVQVTGPIVGTNNLGWILMARVESSGEGETEDKPKTSANGETRIILTHPPIQEFADFQKLLEQRKALTDEQSQLSAQVADAKNHSQQLSQEQADYRARGVRARGISQQTHYWNQTGDEAKARLKDIEKQLEELRAKFTSYPDAAKYSVDTFALDLRQEFAGMHVYERGFVWK